MSKHEMLFTTVFTFSKKVPKILEETMIHEFVRLRNVACNELNLHYEEWNSEFGDCKCDANDPLADFGGTDYCAFIHDKQKGILDKINQRNMSRLVELDNDKIGDIFARCKLDRSITVHLRLENFHEES